MILPDFVLPSRVNKCWSYSGMDHPDHCMNLDYFNSYSNPIQYTYNSRGYRGKEWPSNLTDVVWCIGDSFTSGIGSPLEYTWPYLLEKTIKQPTINVSMDGASNNWIARKAIRLCETVAPKVIIIHWSYIERRESIDTDKNDELRRLSHLPDQLGIINGLLNFQKCLTQVEQNKGNCLVIHSMIPGAINFPKFSDIQNHWPNIASTDWPAAPPTSLIGVPESLRNQFKNHRDWELLSEYYCSIDIFNDTIKDVCYIGMLTQRDLARDGHHYDILTATEFVDSICQTLKAQNQQG